MSHKLIDLNDDLRRLRDKGYNVSIENNHLVVRDIPYVNERREVLTDGVLASSIDLAGEKTIQPSDHTIRFGGERPYSASGVLLDAIRPDASTFQVTGELSTQFHFSSKPKCGHYLDYYEKFNTYATILTTQAVAIDPNASPLTFRVVEPEPDSSPFRYLDTASSRAEISMATAKLSMDEVAIVGLGGTGAYILDLIAKTPVRKIHLYDGDKFASHNAFRAPGATSIEKLHEQPFKVEYLAEIYSNMHTGIVPHPDNMDGDKLTELQGMDFVFLSMDATASKRRIVEKLEEYGIQFVDTGMGLYAKDDTIGGNLRATASNSSNRESARARMSFSTEEVPNEYDRNIQIADLNMMSAVMAVSIWKKSQGFYFNFNEPDHMVYSIGTNRLSFRGNHEQEE